MNRSDDTNSQNLFTRVPSLAGALLIALLSLLLAIGCNDGGGREVVAEPDLCIGDDLSGDSDGDGVCDDLDECDADPLKSEAGDCGCGGHGAVVEVPVGAKCFGGAACRSGVATEVFMPAVTSPIPPGGSGVRSVASTL